MAADLPPSPVEGLVWDACPACHGKGCEVCEGECPVPGYVLIDPSHLGVAPPTSLESEEQPRTDKPVKLLPGGNDPREMAQRSHASRALNKQRREQQAEEMAQGMSDEAILVRVSVPTGHIIKRLAADAAKGSTQAARELRGWLAEVQQERETAVSDLDRTTRQKLLARLLSEIEAEDVRAAVRTEG